MKKHTIFLFLAFYSVITYSQWQPEIRLTNDPGLSNLGYNNTKQISVVGNVIHVVWVDHRNAAPEIYYKRSPDLGISWGNDIRLVYSSGISYCPAISSSDSIVYVAWQDNRFGNEEIMIKRSTNSGLNWSNDIRITNDAANSRTPSIYVKKNLYEEVRLVWEDTRDGNSEIYYTYSLDGGVSFFGQIRISTLNSSSAILPTITCSGLDRHVAWQDNRDGNAEIYYKHTINGGINWSGDTRLTNNSHDSQNPCLIRNNDFIGVVWYDNRDGNNEIYLKTSTNSGNNWSSDKRLTNQSDASARPSLDISGQNIHVAWEDYRDGHSEIYYKRSPDQGLSWSIENRLTNTSGDGCNNPSIYVSGNGVYLIWSYNNEIYFKKDPTGNPIGIKKISYSIADEFRLGQNYPNPFNPVTKIKFEIPTPLSFIGEGPGVRIIIYDILGKEMTVLVDQQLQPGSYEVSWDASEYPSGVYLYRLETIGFIDTKKMILIK